jgi:hypothetical protein
MQAQTIKDFKPLVIEKTANTPQIELDNLTGNLIFSGRSIPENAANVYEPILNWVTKYLPEARPTTNLRINLEYFNTSSLLWLSKIFRILIRINKPDYALIVHLYMPVDDYNEIIEFEDIIDAFGPIEDVLHTKLSNIGIKLHGINTNNEIVTETLVFI